MSENGLYSFNELITIIENCKTLVELFEVTKYIKTNKSNYDLMTAITLSGYLDDRYSELKLNE